MVLGIITAFTVKITAMKAASCIFQKKIIMWPYMRCPNCLAYSTAMH